MPVAGTIASSTAIATKTIISSRTARGVDGRVSSVNALMSGRPSSQSRRLYQQHQHHQHEYHGVGGLGIEVFGQALDHPEREAGDDGAHDGTHAADHDHGKHDDDEVGAHQRADPGY